jgi:hypothetical protein
VLCRLSVASCARLPSKCVLRKLKCITRKLSPINFVLKLELLSRAIFSVLHLVFPDSFGLLKC